MRLFIAINLPAVVREGLWNTIEPLRAAGYPVRWVTEDGLHLTLKFLGEIEDGQLDGVTRALDAAVDRANRFTLAVGGFGSFPPTGRPRVVWVGCEPVPPLELLQHGVERETAALGFPIEGRPFRPHVTLGRARREARARDFGSFDEALQQLEFAAEFVVDGVALMRSQLSSAGARYSERHRAELTGC